MRKEHVPRFQRRIGRGINRNRIIDIHSFDRKPKPRSKGKVIPFKQRYAVRYYHDEYGRIIPKRVYRPMKK